MSRNLKAIFTADQGVIDTLVNQGTFVLVPGQISVAMDRAAAGSPDCAILLWQKFDIYGKDDSLRAKYKLKPGHPNTGGQAGDEIIGQVP